MAVDEAIMRALAENRDRGRPTLRFYQWQPPCLSLGYNQRWAAIDEDACARHGYTWLRRATGGRAILHIDELTYSVVAPASEPRVAGTILESYRRLSQGLLAGLNLLGALSIQATAEKGANALESAACFDSPSYYEITSQNGRKLVGSAQVRRRGLVLQHGALPLYGDISRILEVLKLEGQPRPILRESLFARATTLAEVLGQVVTFEKVVTALAQGFAAALNLELFSAPLSRREQALVGEVRREQFAADAWNRRL